MARPAQHLTISEAIACALATLPLSESTDVEFFAQPGGKFLAIPITERGSAVLPIYNDGSPVFATHERAILAARKMHGAFHCRVKIDPMPTPAEQIEAFRQRVENRTGDDTLFIASGHLYSIGEEPPEKLRNFHVRKARNLEPLGHSGRRFVVRLAGGREVETRNLWSLGPVPHELRDEFADDAEFLEGQP